MRSSRFGIVRPAAGQLKKGVSAARRKIYKKTQTEWVFEELNSLWLSYLFSPHIPGNHLMK